jgi:hypothetical protein
MSNEKWIDTDGLEKEFGIKKSTQALYRSKRKIPFSKIGGFIYYDRKKINEWIENHSVEVAG